MIIEDEELRALYKTSSAERLQKLEDALVFLEKKPGDRVCIEDFLREAHTLKGDSRMLGLKDIETLVHQMEDCLAQVKNGQSIISPQLCDRLYQGIDAVRKLARQAVTGEAAGVNVFLVLAQLMGAQEESPATRAANDNDLLFPEVGVQSSELFNDDLLFPDKKIEIALEEDPLIANNTPALEIIDTIRVDAQKLDRLMNRANELNVTKRSIREQVSDLEELFDFWEESKRHLANMRLKNERQNLDSTREEIWQCLEAFLDRFKNNLLENSSRLESISEELESGIRKMRMLPLGMVFNFFPRMVRDLAKEQGKEIELIVEGGEITADKRIIEEIKDPLIHLLRNAIDHGIETKEERLLAGKNPTATIYLRGEQHGDSISIEVADDGRGLELGKIKTSALNKGFYSSEELAKMTDLEIQDLIFASGFSTKSQISEISGRGIGLDAVRAKIESLKGTVSVESNLGRGCLFRLQLKTSLATTHVLIVEISQQQYAIPIDFVQQMLLVSPQDIFTLEGERFLNLANRHINLVWLADILDLPTKVPSSFISNDFVLKKLPCVILQIGTRQLAILVDALIDEQEIVLKPLDRFLQGIPHLGGATILSNGEICLVLNPYDFVAAKNIGIDRTRLPQIVAKNKPSILLVEDSTIIRTQVKRLLENAGYQVTAAVDGLDGIQKLKIGNFDAIISDVQMPNLDGLNMTAKIRELVEYQQLPIILLTTLATEEDKLRGAEAGATVYLTKGDFAQTVLLDTLKKLI
jgi:two-component system chemotaxis sensor kinase CheA